MLIAFEGQDGAGKTALLSAVRDELGARGVPVLVVEEFSDSPYGQRLVEAVARDKFLRPVPGGLTTVFARALEIVADLYYLDERVIGPALERGAVVLKDRHLDTIFSTLVPTLVRAGAVHDESRALTWLSIMLSELRHQPTVTVYVDAALEVRLKRLAARTRHLHEHRAREVSTDDLDVFAARERVMRQLIEAQPDRFVMVDNGDRPLHDGVGDIVALVEARRAGRS
jgi:thymidylate kinase